MILKNDFMFNNIKIDGLRYQQILKSIDRNIEKKGYICLTEVSGMMRSMKDKELFDALSYSLINIPDGMPLAWFGRLAGATNTERISGVELLKRIMESSGNKYRHFLLGDTDETIERIIKKAKGINPKLDISGYSPPFKDTFTVDDNERMLQLIRSADPDLIWVSFGLGKQEKWMFQNVNKLNRGIMFGVGAAFRYYIGDIIIPHIIIQKMGLQWTTRFIQNPGLWIKGPFIERLNFLLFFPKELMEARKMVTSVDKSEKSNV